MNQVGLLLQTNKQTKYTGNFKTSLDKAYAFAPVRNTGPSQVSLLPVNQVKTGSKFRLYTEEWAHSDEVIDARKYSTGTSVHSSTNKNSPFSNSLLANQKSQPIKIDQTELRKSVHSYYSLYSI